MSHEAILLHTSGPYKGMLGLMLADDNETYEMVMQEHTHLSCTLYLPSWENFQALREIRCPKRALKNGEHK